MLRRSLLSLLVVAFAAGCSKKSDPPPPPPSTCGTHTPIASAAANATAVLPLDVVQLTATSTDEDDTCLAEPEARTYLWTLTSRPAASSAVVSDPTSPSPTLRPDVTGPYQLTVVATDAAGHGSRAAFVTITTSACGELPPFVTPGATVSAIQWNALTVPAPVVSDPNCLSSGTLRYRWELASRPAGSSAILENPTAARPILLPDEVGTYELRVVVTSSVGLSSEPAAVIVTVAPCGLAPPVVAGLTATPATPNAGELVTVGVTGAIADPNEASCGLAVAPFEYRWTILSRPGGSSAALTSDGDAAPSFVADVPAGVYQLSLVVRDALGNASAPAFATVTASDCGANLPAISLTPSAASALANEPVAISATVTDADNACPGFSTGIASVTWSVVSSPGGAAPALADITVPTSDGATPPTFASANTFVATQPGAYVVQAIATASNGTTAAARASIAVSSCGSHAPAIASATASPASALPLEPVQLTATSADPDDSCLPQPEERVYAWRLTSRPPASSAVVSDPASPAPTLTPDVAGAYQLEVVVADAAGHVSAPAFVTVTTSTCGELAPSIAPFGPVYGVQGYAVVLPQPAVSDANCVATGALRYRWDVASRPAGSTAVLSDPALARPTLFSIVEGMYELTVVATNSAGRSSEPARLLVELGRCGGFAPVLPALVASPGAPNAGQVVTLGLAAGIANVNESACPMSVYPYEYRWALLSRPAGSSAVLGGETSPGPSFVADVPNGVYQLSLVVRDGLGNVSAPAFVAVRTTACGAFEPRITLASFPATANANTPADVTADIVDDDNLCPGFSTSIPTVTWTVVSAPDGSNPHLRTSSSVPVTNGLTPPTFRATNGFVADQPGSYVVQATATASNGTSAAAQTTVSVSACGSHAPVIAGVTTMGLAGPLSRPPVGTQLTMTASATDADTACGFSAPGYEWTLVSAPAGSAVVAPAGLQASGALTFTPDVAGAYAWTVTAVDSAGLRSEPRAVSIETATCGPTLANVPGFGEPIALQAPASPAFGGGYTIAPGVTAEVRTATPQDVCIAGGGTVSRAWSLASRPPASAAALSSATAPWPVFTPDVRGTYVIQLVLTDAGGFSSVFSTTVSVECGAPPTVASVPAFPGVPDFSGQQDVVGVNGTTLTIVRSSNMLASYAALWGSAPSGGVPGFYPGYPVQLRANVATSSSCAQAVGYSWSILTQPAGSTAQLNNPSAAAPSFTPDVPGAYGFRLVLTDGTGRSTTTDLAGGALPGAVVIAGGCGLSAPAAVARIAGPIAAASASTEPMARVTLDASSSTAPDATAYPAGCGLEQALSYAWSFVATPPGSSVALTHPGLAGASFVPDLAGTYAVAVDVSDGARTSRATLSVEAVAGYASSATGGDAVFTSVATDLVGNPVVAAWDGVTGTVSVARCTGSCFGPAPTWATLGTLDSGLLPVPFAAGDEPRPIAIAVSPVLATGGPSFGNVFVAYYTGNGPTIGTTDANLPRCSLVLAQWNGTGWNRSALASGANCDLLGGLRFGESVSIVVDPVDGFPVVGATMGNGVFSAPLYAQCNSVPACTDDIATGSASASLIEPADPSRRVGKWISIAVPAAGTLHAAYCEEDDGSGGKGLRYAEGSMSANAFSAARIDSAPATDLGRFPSLAIIPAGTAGNPGAVPVEAILYSDATGKTAKLATCPNTGSCLAPTSWTTSVVVDGTSANTGRATVLGVDRASGALRAAYLDVATSEVRVMSGSAAGQFTELARFPGNGSPAGLSLAAGPRTVVGFTTGTGARVFTGP